MYSDLVGSYGQMDSATPALINVSIADSIDTPGCPTIRCATSCGPSICCRWSFPSSRCSAIRTRPVVPSGTRIPTCLRRSPTHERRYSATSRKRNRPLGSATAPSIRQSNECLSSRSKRQRISRVRPTTAGCKRPQRYICLIGRAYFRCQERRSCPAYREEEQERQEHQDGLLRREHQSGGEDDGITSVCVLRSHLKKRLKARVNTALLYVVTMGAVNPSGDGFLKVEWMGAEHATWSQGLGWRSYTAVNESDVFLPLYHIMELGCNHQ